jgi:hypothetical protein
MHGGARGAGGPRGEFNGNYKHGLWTREEVDKRSTARARMRGIRAYLKGAVRDCTPARGLPEPDAPFGSGFPLDPGGRAVAAR